nr:nadh dehydrogenase [ubiquinone] 1 beta subcomplex subunit 7 [Quercus suber]
MVAVNVKLVYWDIAVGCGIDQAGVVGARHVVGQMSPGGDFNDLCESESKTMEIKLWRASSNTTRMTVTESIKSAVGLSEGGPQTQATREEMSAARLPLAYRDSCAHLLIPLNKCRYDSYYLPWKCNDERHSYEKCQYEEFKLRVKKMDEIREAKGGARSN